NAASTLFRSTGQSGMYVAFQIVQGYGGFAIGLIFVLLLHTDIAGLLWGTIVVTILTSVASWVLLSRQHTIRPRLGPWSDVSSTLKYSLFTSLSSTIFWVLNLSDRWIIGSLRGPGEAGIYSVSYDLAGKTLPIGIIG